MNYTTQPRDSGIPYDQFLSLFDDTRHLASPVATCKLGIDNSAEIAALLGDIDDIIAATAYLDEPEQQIESTPAAIVALAVPDVAEVPEKSVTTDQLMPSIAPAFRGLAPVPTLITSDEARKIRAERIVADLIYLHAQGHRLYLNSSVLDGKFRDMMSADALDLNLAREFATLVSSKTSNWSGEYLATSVLFIPATLQVRLCQLATERIRRGRARLLAGEATTRARLECSLRQSGDAKLIRHAPLWAELWVCDSLIKLAVDRRSPQEVSALWEAMTGRKMGRSDVAKKLKTIDKHIA
ncbi:MAG: hypothetical protein ABTQ25_17440 [Nitrosomonas ureae]